MKIALTFLAIVCLAACTAPQGKRLKANPIALASMKPMNSAMLDENTPSPERNVWLKSKGTVTVLLGSQPHTQSSWHLGEIPDATVLKLVSRSPASPMVNGATASGARLQAGSRQGGEKWVFEAVGPGSVPVRLWFAPRDSNSVTDAHRYAFTVSVD